MSAPRLAGRFRPPGDKSISHRALMLAARASGSSLVLGLNPGADVRSTRVALAALGVPITDVDGGVRVEGRDGDWHVPAGPLDCGNSGTTLRLLMGLLAAAPGRFVLAGDASLSARPMGRVAGPLARMGARIRLTAGDHPPVELDGAPLAAPAMPETVRSAQVKSALLLAGLSARGTTVLVEAAPSRDHTERMLGAFGVTVRREGRAVSMTGPAGLRGLRVDVPADPSAAAFLLVAAAMLPGSSVTADGIGINPTRRAWIDILGRMGALIGESGRGAMAGGVEPTADVTVRAAELRGTRIAGEEAALAIDELPILAVAACAATGETTIADAAELRVKESDRIAVLVAGLRRLGATVEERPDGLGIQGGGAGFRFRGGAVDARGDHRLAMAFRVAALRADGAVVIDGAESAAVSDPDFERTLAGLLG